MERRSRSRAMSQACASSAHFSWYCKVKRTTPSHAVNTAPSAIRHQGDGLGVGLEGAKLMPAGSAIGIACSAMVFAALFAPLTAGLSTAFGFRLSPVEMTGLFSHKHFCHSD